MEAVEEIRSLMDAKVAINRRRCPQCHNYLFLESVYGEGYWWSCLICGWERPIERRKTE